MAYLYRTQKKNGSPHARWRFQYRDWQGAKRKATGYTSRTETEKLANQIQAEHDAIKKGLKPPPKVEEPSLAFEEIEGKYLAWGETQGGRGGRPWSPRHLEKRRTHLAWWKETLKLSTLLDLRGSLSRVEDVLGELRGEGRAGKTLANRLETLTAFCDWCVRREYLKDDPLKRLSPIDTTPLETRRALTQEEIQRLFSVAPAERRILYEVAFCTGLRANELRQLTVSHLDSKGATLRLDSAWTKNRKEGFQPLPRELAEHLAERVRGKEPHEPLLSVPSHPARDLDKDLKRAGIPKRIAGLGKVDFHACRVAYTTFVVEAGANVKEAQTLLRHSTPQLTLGLYARDRRESLGRLADTVGQMVLSPGQNPAPTEPPLGVIAESEKVLTPVGSGLSESENWWRR